MLALQDGQAIRGDMILSATLRRDMVPIPASIEASIRVDPSVSEKFADGQVLLAHGEPFRIIKSQPKGSAIAPGGWTGDTGVQTVAITAIPDGLEALIKPQPRGVVKIARSMGEVYRACGAKSKVDQDVPIDRFVCPAGSVATFGIARMMQQELAAPLWRNSGLSMARIPDLFSGKPSRELRADALERTWSAWLETIGTVRAYSTDTQGATIYGGPDGLARPLAHLPRSPQRVLNNMGRMLCVRAAMPSVFDPTIMAGDLWQVGGVRMVVVTVASQWRAGADGGPSNQVSRVWLGELKG